VATALLVFRTVATERRRVRDMLGPSLVITAAVRNLLTVCRFGQTDMQVSLLSVAVRERISVSNAWLENGASMSTVAHVLVKTIL
jgi:uncharacterized membrane protein